LKEYRIEKAIMFVGKGRNGKSKTLELMKRFIGIENCSAIPLRNLTEDSFELSDLFSKMANLAGDLSNSDLRETGMIKQLIGRDIIAAKRKFLKVLKFVNYAKMIFAANELPKVYDTTDGFWTKWVLIEFPYKFVNKKEFKNSQNKKNLKILNPDIMEELSTGEELSGLLNLALDGLDRLSKQKDFGYSKNTKQVKDMWIRQSDSFTSFCIDNLEEDEFSTITKKEMRREYFLYCKENKLKGVSDKAIKITLQNKYGVEESRKQHAGTQEYTWEGVRFKVISC